MSLTDSVLMHIVMQSDREFLQESQVGIKAENTQAALGGNCCYPFDHQTAVSACLSA